MLSKDWIPVLTFASRSLKLATTCCAAYDFRLTQIKRAREIGRIVVGTGITLGFLFGIPVMMAWGRQSRSSGDSIAKRRKEWIRKLQRERRKEKDIEAASARDADNCIG